MDLTAPGTNGYIYSSSPTFLLLTCLRPAKQKRQISCDTHGTAYQPFVCEHLVTNPDQGWFSEELIKKILGLMLGAVSAKLSSKHKASGTRKTKNI
jgi:hypothetical protein